LIGARVQWKKAEAISATITSPKAVAAKVVNRRRSCWSLTVAAAFAPASSARCSAA